MKATHRYLLVIKPSPEVSAAVSALRERLFARIGSFGGLKVIPHITLFFADLDLEAAEPIMDAIDSGITGQQTFDLRYKGITHFPDKHTIYIDPLEKEAIAAMRGPIIQALNDQSALRDHIRETDHPHLSIAAGLKPAQFDEAWSTLAPHDFSAAHRVGEVLLLRRELSSGAAYVELRSFAG
ncbi:MAG: 2'-5' RNA ligase family protein [Flavobacteriales bacterium]|nr:2'-5' RNA ligase family protein [Flavobacteriales bacterium]